MFCYTYMDTKVTPCKMDTSRRPLGEAHTRLLVPCRSRHKYFLWIWLLCLCQQVVPSLSQVPLDCKGRMDIIFVLDSSESMIENDPFGQPYYHWRHLLDFTKSVVNKLPVDSGDTKVGLVQYSNQPVTVFDLKKLNTTLSIEYEINNNVRHNGGITYTAKALRHTRDRVFYDEAPDRRSIPNKVVLMTDGLSNFDLHDTVPSADYLKSNNIEIFTVGITKYIDEGELRNIASVPRDRHFLHMPDFEMMAYYVDVLTHRLCDLPDPTPPVPTPPQCEVKTDLALLVDNSGSIRDKNPKNDTIDNYVILKDFLASMIDTLDISPSTTRVAALRFSTDSILEFNLDTYQNKSEVKRAIYNMPYVGSYTNIYSAIHMARTQIFIPNRGDRPGVRNVAIIITDGESTKDQHLTIDEAELARDSGIILFVVGVTDEVNDKELKGIASSPTNEHYFNSTDISNLNSIFVQLLKYVCNNSPGVSSSRGKRDLTTSCDSPDGCPDLLELEQFDPSQEVERTKYFAGTSSSSHIIVPLTCLVMSALLSILLQKTQCLVPLL